MHCKHEPTGLQTDGQHIKQHKHMKQITNIAEAANYKAVNLGQLKALSEYELTLGPNIKIPGKVFGGSALGTTGCEFSMQSFMPGTETGFLHTHKKHEELYFFLSGHGEFQVDGDVFPIAEGSVVRVSPMGKRSVRNTGDSPLIMLCIQYLGNSFLAEDAEDGVILDDEVKW